MKYILAVICLLLSTPAISCSCKEIKELAAAQKQELDRSDLVFIGEVISSKKEEFQLRIVEIFKGKPVKKIVIGRWKHSCALYPRKEEGLWLIYATVLPDGTIGVSQCGLSRSYGFPYAFSKEIQVPPPPRLGKDGALDQLDQQLLIVEHKHKALLVLRKEIEQLRRWRR